MNRLVYVSLFFSVFGLVLVYFSALSLEPITTEISQINSEHVGKTVEVVGFVSSVYHSDETILLTLSDGEEKIQVVIFSNLEKELENSGLQIEKNMKMRVRGVVDEYKNKLEIAPRKTSDIRILDDL